MEQDRESIPEPTGIAKFKLKENQCIAIIEAWMPPFRDAMERKAVEKLIPK